VGVDRMQLDPAQTRQAQILLHSGKLIEKEHRYYNPDLFLADEVALFLLG